MSAKTIGVAGLMALAGLALVAVIASNPFSTQASTHDATDNQETQERLSADVAAPSQVTQPDQLGQLQATDDDSEKVKPYIGVVVIEMEDGSVKVARVQKGGPSDGALMIGDLITAVDGTTIDGTSDLIDAIEDAGSGTTITLTITRDGASQTVDVTVGERDTSGPTVRMYRWSKTYSPSVSGFRSHGKGKLGAVMGGRAVHSKVVFENEDGSFSTYRAVVGTVSNLDAAAGTFTLNPKDGSGSIDYTISDDTKVNMSRDGDLGALNTDDDTLVVDVDGEVQLVQQGERAKQRMGFFKGGKRLGFDGAGRWHGSSRMEERKSMIEEALEAIRSQLDDKT